MICPLCNKQMIPSKIECHDLSGWSFGWLCECNDETRKETPQLVVYSDKECSDGLDTINRVLGG